MTAAAPEHVVVVGGGLTGLVAALRLSQGGAAVTVVEPDRLGGKIQTSVFAGRPVDEGADASLRNEQGLTAIDFARRADRDSVAEMIANRLRSLPSAPRW